MKNQNFNKIVTKRKVKEILKKMKKGIIKLLKEMEIILWHKLS